jgi:benzoyl-CoA reductase/2-hydroxyglutaryl-CoA dehydratase subunit BcrC/BadD/HgdB
MEELRARLETISGSGISDTALTEAIARHDQARSLFGKLSDLGRGLPATISGTTMLHLAGCGQTLPIDTFTALLEQSMNLQPNASPGPRLMVKGSPQEHAHFYQMVEATGATIVADDHDWGEALYRVPVGSAPDPLTALVNHCMVHRPGPRRLPQDMVDAEFIGLVRERRVDGVIFALEQHDDTLGWDYPAQKRALDELGVPSILLTGQRYDIVEQATTDAVIRFVRELQS